MAKISGRGFPTPGGYIAAIAVSRGFSVASRDASPYLVAGVSFINPWNQTLPSRPVGQGARRGTISTSGVAGFGLAGHAAIAGEHGGRFEVRLAPLASPIINGLGLLEHGSPDNNLLNYVVIIGDG